MAVPQLVAVVDAKGTTIRISLLTTALAMRPVVACTDPATADSLYVAILPDSAGSWQWKVNSVQDQVLVIATDNNAAGPVTVLLNASVRRVLSRELKKSGQACSCHDSTLEALRLYHALSLLLFSEGNYRGCQDHLTLLQDLEPCPCSC